MLHVRFEPIRVLNSDRSDLILAGSFDPYLHGGAHWCHVANTTEPSVCGGDVALCQITLTTYYAFLSTNMFISNTMDLAISLAEVDTG